MIFLLSSVFLLRLTFGFWNKKVLSSLALSSLGLPDESEDEIDQVPVQALTGFIQRSEIVDILVEALAEEDITVEDLQSLPREELKSTFLTGFRKKRTQKAGMNISRTVAVISAFFLLIILIFQSWFV